MKLAVGTFICAAGLAAAVQAQPVQPPHNSAGAPSNTQASQAASQAATAEMRGDAQAAVKLADQGIAADRSDPWPYYNKAEALAKLGQPDAAAANFSQAEQRFPQSDRWGRSVAIFGRAHTLAQAGRCQAARTAFNEYASLLYDDPNAARLARRYSDDCDTANRAAQP